MRRVPTTKLDVFGSYCPLTANVLTCQTDESNINLKTLIKPPQHKANAESVELFAIETGEEHNKMLHLQSQMIQHNEQQAHANANDTIQLERHLIKLRESLINFNLFMQSCDEKKRIANKTINKERLVHEELKRESANLRDLIGIMTKFREELLKTIAELEPYERVLKETIGVQQVWTSAGDCLLRCDALMLTQIEIITMKNDKLSEMENIRLSMAKMTNNALISILGLNTALNNLERDLMRARRNCFHWENILTNIKRTIVEEELESTMMTEAIDVLYKILCTRRNISPAMSIEARSLEKRMNFIREEIHILGNVYDLCVKEMEEQEKAESFR